jgi:hypothetical protein
VKNKSGKENIKFSKPRIYGSKVFFGQEELTVKTE